MEYEQKGSSMNFPSKSFERNLVILTACISCIATVISLFGGTIVAYGDAESHLNIAKRVVDSLTPGAAQLGSVWLPMPHILMIPFVWIDILWSTGLAGSIVSGFFYVVSSFYLYRLVMMVTGQQPAALAAWAVYALNPNILYMQTTPMSEITLIGFFVLSTYYFMAFLKNPQDIGGLVLAAFFGCMATLSRYDGWLLVLVQAVIIGVLYLPKLLVRHGWVKLEATVLTYGTLAFFGIVLWFLWGFLIMGDPLYFTNSVFSAKTQQKGWLLRGELPSYHNLEMAIRYYLAASVHNIGLIVSAVSGFGAVVFVLVALWKRSRLFWLALVLFTPFLFYVITQYIGQSIILIPDLTPASYSWRLFNVRYGIVMVPAAAFFAGYLLSKTPLWFGKGVVMGVLSYELMIGNVFMGKLPITLEDGLHGLSHSKSPDAEQWFAREYDGGLVLMDDYARTMSIIRSNMPIDQVIYIGNKPYWNESLEVPHKYATWIVMQKSDAVWKELYDNETKRALLFAHFNKVYTSPDILIFKRMPAVSVRYGL